MAANNLEIEIRIPLDENIFSDIKEKLEKFGKFEKSFHHIDDYFTPVHRNFLEPRYPFEWLSIRKRGGKTILCYKHFHPENVENTTHCDEFETEITNPENLEKMFATLNFRKLITVEKEREVYLYKDEFEIALDDVKELGRFIEIEALKDLGGIEVTRNKLFELARTFGIDTSKESKRGYPHLLLKKKGLIK